jgi:hypothetical protein
MKLFHVTAAWRLTCTTCYRQKRKDEDAEKKRWEQVSHNKKTPTNPQIIRFLALTQLLKKLGVLLLLLLGPLAITLEDLIMALLKILPQLLWIRHLLIEPEALG